MNAKTLTLTLIVVGIAALAAKEARAAGAIPFPMSAHQAAKYGIQDPGLPAQVRAIEHAKAQAKHIQQVSYRHGGHHGKHGHHGRHHGHHGYRHHGYHGYHGCRPVVHPPVIVAPYGGYYPAYPYYVPRYGVSYHGRGVSVGIGF